MIYQYRAYRSDKQVSSGTIEAASEGMAERALYEAGFQYVLSLQVSPPRRSLHSLLPTLFGVKSQDIIDFSRQLATFVTSGFSLLFSLQLLEEQITKPAMKEVVAGLIKELQAGSSLSQALNNYPHVFPRFYWQYIRTSEKTGDLDNGLKQISDYLETRSMMASKIMRALSYPLFVILIAIGVMVMMMTTVLPAMLKLFESFKADMPAITLMVINSVNFVNIHKIQILVVIAAIVFGIWLFSRLPGGKRAMDRIMLKLPVAGPVVLYRNLGNFCRTVSMLLRAGLPLPEIMEVTIQTTGNNTVFIQALKDIREKLIQGEGLAHSMKEAPVFPGMMVKMVTTGEQTGTFETTFATLADYYERQTDQRIKTLISWIEPVMTVIIGLVVSLMLFSVIIPIYQISGKVH